MANKHASLSALFTDIANAIREKTGDTASIVADQFPEKISMIEGGGASLETFTITFTANYGGENGFLYVNEDGQSTYSGALSRGTHTIKIAKSTLTFLVGIGSGSSTYVTLKGSDMIISHAISKTAGSNTDWSSIFGAANIPSVKDFKILVLKNDTSFSN